MREEAGGAGRRCLLCPREGAGGQDWGGNSGSDQKQPAIEVTSVLKLGLRYLGSVGAVAGREELSLTPRTLPIACGYMVVLCGAADPWRRGRLGGRWRGQEHRRRLRSW